MLASLLLVPFLLAPQAETGLERSSVDLKDLQKLGKPVASFFDALEAHARGDQQESVEEAAKEIERIEKRAKLPRPLLAYPGDWEYVFEMAKPEDRAMASKVGRGFFRHYFMDPSDEVPYVYLLRIPDGYDDATALLPAIVALLPDLGLRGEALEAEALRRVELAYAGIDDRLILVPLGRGEGSRPDRAEATEVEGSWMTDEGLLCMFSVFRVLLEQVRVDRSRIVLDGWGDAGTDAFRIASAFPSWWAGVVNRGGGELAEDMILSNLGGAPVLYVAGASDAIDLDALRATERTTVTVIEGQEDPTALAADAAPRLAEWLETARRDLAPVQVDYRVADIRYQSVAWLKAGEINRRAAAKPDDADFPRIRASVNRGTNTIEIDTTNVFELWVFLSDALVDLDKDVTIKVNGEVRTKETFRRSLREMLENRFFNASGDYGVYVTSELIDEIDANVNADAGSR